VLYDTHGAGQAYYGLINGKKIKSAGSCKIRMDILWNVGEFYLFIFFFLDLVRFLFWRNLFISFYFPCSVPVYLSYTHVYTLKHVKIVGGCDQK
jgi:hypothetical protein